MKLKNIFSKIKKILFRDFELFNTVEQLRLNQATLKEKIYSLTLKTEEIKWYLDDHEFFDMRERQVAPLVKEIRVDHTARYKFSVNYIKKNDKVLDVACGIGYGSYIIAKDVPEVRVIGIDIQEMAISYAKRFYNSNKIEFKQMDCLSLPFPESSFDVITAFEIIEHLYQYNDFLNNINRLLKIEGILLISTPNENVTPFDPEKYPFHVRHFTAAEFKKMLENHGFKVIGAFSQSSRYAIELETNENGFFLIFVAKKQ